MSIVLFAVLLVACGGGGGGSAATPSLVVAQTSVTAVKTPAPSSSASPSPSPTQTAPAGVTNLTGVTDFQSVASALSASQRSDGAIPYTSTQVMPYFANLAATGAAHTGSDLTVVRNYIAWYVLRSKDANPWGISGAITDYTILASGTLQSAGSADSVDAYAATFLTLVAAAWQYGDAPTRAYVLTLQSDVNRIASAIDAVTDGDGFTWALPTYKVKYLMDQSEVYAGLNDLATLRSSAYGDIAGSLVASQRAATLKAAIVTAFWSSARNTFATGIDANGALELPASGNWSDATAQLWPILHGVIAPSASQAISTYANFNAAFPAWDALSKPDEYPWVSVAYVALLMNDTTRANAYRAAAFAGYAPAFAYPWYCAESGWYLRLVDGLVAPQTIAAD